MRRLLIAFAWIGAFWALAPVHLAQAQEKAALLYGLQLEELEYQRGDEDEDLLAWNGDAFIGTDEIKLRWLGEGEYDKGASKFENLENRLVLQTPISTFFDIKGGVRLDTPNGADRWYGVIGLAGLAPQWFEIDADVFVSETGDTKARLDVEYELLLTNYLILTPSAEVNLALSPDREIGVGSGVSGIEAGARLSYDVIDRTFSPYLGFVHERKFGQTADFARDEGEDVEGWRVVFGARLMF
ncbi:MAG: copper resistance protein B [Rhodospirillaceae bacterium]|jgi:copper resistance protein B|nr:copper resistance protein B [Rhodospirillaceae bacterium]